MFREITVMGYKAHLVLEDERGAFEVRDPFEFIPASGGDVRVNLNRINEAIAQRENTIAPLFREVKFDVG